jgi:acetoin utilization deacetylase AcuC-like enzyme
MIRKARAFNRCSSERPDDPSSMKLFFDQRQARHAPLRELNNGEWTPYAEVPERALSILRECGSPVPARDFGIEPILAVHDPDYVAFLRSAHERWRAVGRSGDAIGYAFPIVGRRPLPLSRIDGLLGAYSFDAATPIAEHTWEAAYWAAQSALSGLEEVLVNGASCAFALCRPPGHHAGRDYMGGYCYLNNAAIAARRASALGAGPVAILDVDYHHGNGTQDIFLGDATVFYASIHADPASDYPYYWGHADETGEGAGAGATLNLPLPRGTTWPDYAVALDQALDAIRAWGARLLIVSFGADTFGGDPISHFRIEQDDYSSMATAIRGLALPTLVVMEGGYAVDDLGRNVAAFLSGFE